MKGEGENSRLDSTGSFGVKLCFLAISCFSSVLGLGVSSSLSLTSKISLFFLSYVILVLGVVSFCFGSKSLWFLGEVSRVALKFLSSSSFFFTSWSIYDMYIKLSFFAGLDDLFKLNFSGKKAFSVSFLVRPYFHRYFASFWDWMFLATTEETDLKRFGDFRL